MRGSERVIELIREVNSLKTGAAFWDKVARAPAGCAASREAAELLAECEVKLGRVHDLLKATE